MAGGRSRVASSWNGFDGRLRKTSNVLKIMKDNDVDIDELNEFTPGKSGSGSFHSELPKEPAYVREGGKIWVESWSKGKMTT